MIRRSLVIFLGASLLGGCSTANISLNKGFDYSRIKRVGVVRFKDHPKRGGSGEAVTSAFEQSLLAAGYDVLDGSAVASAVGGRMGPLDAKTAKDAASRLGADALVMGQITEFVNPRETKVNVKVLADYDDPLYETRVVHIVDPNGVPMDIVQKVAVGHRRGQRYRNEPRAYTVPGKLAVSARMVYPATGEVVWAGTDATDASYPEAARAVADDILRAGKVAWPKK